MNEARNQIRMRDAMKNVPRVYVPKVYTELTTAKMLVSEWLDGVKLSELKPEETLELVAVGQEVNGK